MKTDSTLTRQYADRDHMDLGDYYVRHVSAMTGEGLHAKSDIAGELAWRDREIDRLRATQGAATPPAPADEKRALQEIHNWLVCWPIASPEDMAQSFEHMEGVAGRALGYVPEGVSDAEWFGEATPPAIREPEPTNHWPFGKVASAATGFEKRIFDFAAGEDGGWMAWETCSEADYLHFDGRRADIQVRALATPAPAPSIPVVHPAGLAPGAVEQGSSNTVGAARPHPRRES